MASGRVIHKVLHSNPQLCDLSIPERYFYVSVVVHADDEGRMRANPKHLKALLFPFDQTLRPETITDWLFALQAAGLVNLYAVDGKEYLYHPNWKMWQTIRSDRFKPSDCPNPSSGIPLVNQAPRNLTLPNPTQPNLIKRTASPALNSCPKCKGKGVYKDGGFEFECECVSSGSGGV